MDELLTKTQVAKLLKVKLRTVTYLTATRQLPFIKGLGREYRYLLSSILEWVKTKEIKPENTFLEP